MSARAPLQATARRCNRRVRSLKSNPFVLELVKDERVTQESFNRYRKIGGFVIASAVPQAVVDACVSPQPAIATDGLLENGKGHPRASGTYSLVFGRTQKHLMKSRFDNFH